MAELESVLEERLIDQLCNGESQWTYRPDIKNEEQLWANFKYILEQNNKAELDDVPLSDSEFAKIKNDVSHSSFYEAGRWLVGEKGKVLVHIQRGNKSLHLTVMNNEHIAGGNSVYEVINQYQAYGKADDERDRRFDVTLLINGIPLIHIELKNKEHSYMEGFHQIHKYVSEGKFRGLYSNVQMFVVSNEADTRYFAAARASELNKKFITGWLDEKNEPVNNYLEFAKRVLKIPEAHEIVTKYVVLDNDKKRLLILRPYQIHAIEAMRAASKTGTSGFIWHTTGSGKTMTSYKSTRNLLMDIPSIDKTVFLLDRKDLDKQTSQDFKSYADYDTIDVDDTENVTNLINKLKNNDRQMIVTTRQKIQIMINKRLEEGSSDYNKIKSKRIAFVVDECHRAVSPEAKRRIETFFNNSLWYGFTGTPIFEENSYERKGDLPQTTEQMYGKPLHSYTIKEAIHDEAVLGFMVENLGPNQEVEDSVYDTEAHKRSVLNVILNQSYAKFGMGKGRGNTYEALLTVSSIKIAQEYYDLLTKIKEGNDELKINENVIKALPDFPKFAITYSVSENEESSQVNQEKMSKSLEDYNNMFDTSYKIQEIQAYNNNLNDRLARKMDKYKQRDQQLDLVIVVNRLLTGFDAPCLSTVFIDRQPMKPQDIIQTFSRTNRLFDETKQHGYIVTFQSPKEFKEEIDSAIKLYSLGGDGQPIAEDWDTVLETFQILLKALRGLAETPQDALNLSDKQKRTFIQLFRGLDTGFAHLKAFSNYTSDVIEELGFSDELYEDYAAAYLIILSELPPKVDDDPKDDDPVIDDYDLIAHTKFKIDYEYIISLIQGLVSEKEIDDEKTYQKNIAEIRNIINDYKKDNARLGELLEQVLDGIEENRDDYFGKDISALISDLRNEGIDKEVAKFAKKWFIPEEDVKYEVLHYHNGNLSNENNFKNKADYTAYKNSVEEPIAKFRFFKALINDFKDGLMAEIGNLI